MKELGIVATVVAIIMLLRYKNRLKLKEGWLTDVWRSDFRIVFITGILLAILNPMFKYMTSAIPDIWDWYWSVNNPLFFVFFNIGWLAYAYFSSKKDKDNKPIPEAKDRARVVFWAIVIFTLINLGGLIKEKITSNSSEITIPSVITHPSYANVPAVIAVPIFCDAESGDGTPGSARQFVEGEVDEDERMPPSGIWEFVGVNEEKEGEDGEEDEPEEEI